jgi:hypothetical protein
MSTFSTCLWSDIINEAIADIGALAAGQTISPSAQTDAFLRLGQLIDSFSADPLLALFEVQHNSFALTAGTPSYFLGPSAGFLTTFPPVRVTGGSTVSGFFRQPMRLVSFDQFSKEAANPRGAQATLPYLLAADTAYPNIQLKVHEPPLVNGVILELHYWISLTQPTAVTATVSLPNGFQRALVKNLAVTLYPQYTREKGVDPVLLKEAQDSLDFIRNLNRAMLAEGISQQTSIAPPASPQTEH